MTKKNMLIEAILVLIVTFIGIYIMNSSIAVSEINSSSYIIIENKIPHYEFNEDSKYIEYLTITYKIKPPFISFAGNSKTTVNIPKGYNVESITKCRGDEIITTWVGYTDKWIITSKQKQFRDSECSLQLILTKKYKKEELITINLNSSWRNELDENRFYEEEGILLTNNLNIPIKEYLFVYNQTNNSQIKKIFLNCNEIQIYLDQKKYPFRNDFIHNLSVITLEIDFEPLERKKLRLRCYYDDNSVKSILTPPAPPIRTLFQ